VTLEAIGALIDRSISKLATKEDLKAEICKIDDRLSFMDKRFDAIDGKLFEFTGKFIKIDERLDSIDARFDVLERKVDRMNDSFTNQLDYFNLYCPTRKEFTELDDRMKKVEKKLKV
jgi:tetrahydromethanopterin S-methyltransferase subunit G